MALTAVLTVFLSAVLPGTTLAAPSFTGSPAAAISKNILKQRPKLILVVVIDQFRADYLMRFREQFRAAHGATGVGGFSYLTQDGAYFPYGQYDILQSMTGPGHATILSGSYPYLMGIPLNEWFDQNTHEPVYCVEDSTMPLVGAATRKHAGTSPRNFTGSTVGDELKNAGLASRVIAVSLKDRAAILMGGKRADLAAWFDSGTKHWITSRYYRSNDQLPDWMNRLNSTLDTQFKNTPCDLATECGIELTETAAESAFTNEKLGQGTDPDLLAVSFSSHDYAGHQVGPNDPLMEKMTLAEDRSLAKLFSFVGKKVPGGLSNVLIAFTGDHGVPPSPDWLDHAGMHATGRIDPVEVQNRLEERLTKRFGKAPGTGKKWIIFENDLQFYFDEGAIREKDLSLADIENEARQIVQSIPGVAFIITSHDYTTRQLPPGMVERQALHTHVAGRGGNLLLLPKPYYFEVDAHYPVNHMTGWNYDRTVPIIFAGFGVKPGLYASPAAVIDIAPTLTFLSSVLPPALSEGRVLEEALTTTKR